MSLASHSFPNWLLLPRSLVGNGLPNTEEMHAALLHAGADAILLEQASLEAGTFVRLVSEALLQCLGFLQSRREERIALALCHGEPSKGCLSDPDSSES